MRCVVHEAPVRSLFSSITFRYVISSKFYQFVILDNFGRRYGSDQSNTKWKEYKRFRTRLRPDHACNNIINAISCRGDTQTVLHPKIESLTHREPHGAAETHLMKVQIKRTLRLPSAQRVTLTM